MGERIQLLHEHSLSGKGKKEIRKGKKLQVSFSRREEHSSARVGNKKIY